MTGRTRTRVTRVLATVLAAAVVVPVVAVIDGAFSSQAATYVSGVDVSVWDHSGGTAINWPKVRAGGRSFAIVKATESTNYTNPYFSSDFPQARAAGLVVGAYHFARPRLPISSAADQARYYVSAVQANGSFRTAGTLPPVLDLEVTGGLSRANLIAWAQTFLTTAKALTGRKPIFYSYDSYVRSTLGNTTQFAGYPLWYARYTNITPSSSMLPGGWQQWTMWQYSSTTGTPGIVGTGDVSLFNGSITALRAFANGTTSGIAPPAAPTDAVATPTVASASLMWKAPVDNGGTPVNRYRVSIDSGQEVFTPTTKFVATALTPGDHTFAIRAENIAGPGPALKGKFTIAPYDATAVITPAAVALAIVAPPTGSAAVSTLVKVTLRRVDTSQALAGARIALTVRPELGPALPPVTVTTGADGTATAYVRPPVDARLTLSLPAGAWYAAATASASMRVLPALSASSTATSVRLKGAVRITGAASPLLARTRVYRQLYTGGRWVTKTTGTLSSTGRYSFTVTATTKGRKVMRVLLPGTTHYLTAPSRMVVLTVR